MRPRNLFSISSGRIAAISSSATVAAAAAVLRLRPDVRHLLLIPGESILQFPSKLSPPFGLRPRRRRCFHSASNAAMPSSEAAVRDKELLQKKKSAIKNAGPSKLQVIADFDGTLTKYWTGCGHGQTSHGLLQQGNAEYEHYHPLEISPSIPVEEKTKLMKEWLPSRQALYEHYHPLEISPSIPVEEKTKLMKEWWGKTHALLIEGGLTYDAIKKSVSEATISFRDGVAELFELLEERGVPMLVFSAGLADIIEEVFRQKLLKSFQNIKVVSNRMVFDENDHLVAFKGKTIHVLNKNEHALDMCAPLHEKLGDPNGLSDDSLLVKNRANVLLLGDHIGDLGMSDGLNYENRIAVGFLNDNVEKSLNSYLEAFDIVYLNDASMRGVLELASELCSETL